MKIKNIITSITSSVLLCLSTNAQSPDYTQNEPSGLDACYTAMHYISNTNDTRLTYYKMAYPGALFSIRSAAFWGVSTVIKSRIDGVYSKKTNWFTYNPFLLSADGLKVELTPIQACNKPNNYIVGQIWLFQPGTTNVVDYGHISIVGKGN